jgi:hypothetical protein
MTTGTALSSFSIACPSLSFLLRRLRQQRISLAERIGTGVAK